jgi:hypothetical protein
MRSATGSVAALTDVWKYAPSSFDPCAVNFTAEDRIKAKQEVSPDSTVSTTVESK